MPVDLVEREHLIAKIAEKDLPKLEVTEVKEQEDVVVLEMGTILEALVHQEQIHDFILSNCTIFHFLPQESPETPVMLPLKLRHLAMQCIFHMLKIMKTVALVYFTNLQKQDRTTWMFETMANMFKDHLTNFTSVPMMREKSMLMVQA
jgi:hypothetical protein